jgi:hypothetical protein
MNRSLYLPLVVRSANHALHLPMIVRDGYHDTPFISVAPPPPVVGWLLSLGPNIQRSTLSIQSNSRWSLEVSSLGPYAWHMAEHDGAQWVDGGGRLAESLRVRAPAQGTDVSEGTSSRLASGAGSQDLLVEFAQSIRYSDPPAAEGNFYRVILVFTGYVEL